jgi:hypothetical protein
VERISTQHRGRAAFGDHGGDPLGGIGRKIGDLGGAFGSEGVEEPAQGGLVAARGGPQQPAGVVVDDDGQVHDDGQVLVVAFVGDLVDTDPSQVSEAVDAASWTT